jgi:hypothetical protein
MSLYYNPELVRLLMNERIREAGRARMVRDGEHDCGASQKRSILDLFRRQDHQVPAACAC